MSKAPNNEEILVKFRLIMATIMQNTKNTKDLISFEYALVLATQAISEEMCMRNKNE